MIDTCTSFHCTPRRDIFISYQSGDFGIVRMRNNDILKIVGKGDVYVETNDGCKLVLKDVRHVLDLRLNLISAKKIYERML